MFLSPVDFFLALPFSITTSHRAAASRSCTYTHAASPSSRRRRWAPTSGDNAQEQKSKPL
jgi:hypothetical protein